MEVEGNASYCSGKSLNAMNGVWAYTDFGVPVREPYMAETMARGLERSP